MITNQLRAKSMDNNITNHMEQVYHRTLSYKLSFLWLALLLAVSTSLFAQDTPAATGPCAGDRSWEALLKANCAACHKLDKNDGTCP